MKEGEEMRLKSTIYESTLSTAGAVPLPQWGRLRYENTAFLDTTPFAMGKAAIRGWRYPRIVKANTGYVGKQYRRTKPSPRGEGGERSEPDRVLAV